MSESTIKKRVWTLLDKNPLLLPKQICNLLHLDYKQYANYVTFLKSKWKHYIRDKRGLKGLSFHHWHGWVYAPKTVNRELAVKQGWIRTRAKNRYLLWKDRNGRLEWFETGRVKVWVRKPPSMGKAYQLLSDAFFNTALIFDIRVFERFLKSLRFKRASATLDLGERLPYARVDFLKDSNGVVITLGDKSHPTALEIDFCYPDWGEKTEGVLARLLSLLEGKPPEPNMTRPERIDYRV